VVKNKEQSTVYYMQGSLREAGGMLQGILREPMNNLYVT
jgi:hypothetical protein